MAPDTSLSALTEGSLTSSEKPLLSQGQDQLKYQFGTKETENNQTKGYQVDGDRRLHSPASPEVLNQQHGIKAPCEHRQNGFMHEMLAKEIIDKYEASTNSGGQH